MPKYPSFYTLLGLRRSATPEEIRRSYLKSAKRLHPDTNIGPGETELFLDVQQAYQVLSDPSRRSAYDATLPPEEEIPSVVNQRILVSRKELSQLKELQLVYLLVEISPKKELTDTVNSVPLNICLALDCSTSMKGEKLDTVKATAIQLIRKLKPQDIFSVVSFSDRAEVVIPATRQGSTLKMENRVQLLQTSGGTEIFQGLKASLEEIRQFRNSKYINHIILLTDGRTYGDEQSSYQLAKEATKENIGISGLGIGSGWNDIFLDQLASLTGGQAMLVSKPDDIERLLTEKFANLSQTLAENVTFEYQTDENVEISYAFRIQPEAAPLVLENPLQLGPIIQGGPLSVLFELSIRPRSVKADAISIIQGTLDISAAALQTPIYPISIDITLPVEETAHPETPPSAIIQALSKLTLYRLQEKARKEVANGNYVIAAEHLQKLATHLLAQGERNLAKTVMLEIAYIDKEKTFSENGEKQIKYGTRALLLPGEHKL
jgi:Ca-activated chloride channel family protein